MNLSLEWHVLVLHTSQDRSLGVSNSAVRVNKIMFYFESFVIKSVKVAGKCIIYKDIQFPKLANISKVASVMKFLVSAEKGKALVNKDMHTARWMYYSQITYDKLYFFFFFWFQLPCVCGINHQLAAFDLFPMHINNTFLSVMSKNNVSWS